jgi:light-regulated signal transduction histidine kinase (bacteriophytochrome)
MQVLINDLLAYSRVGTRGKPFQSTDCEAVVGTVLGNLSVAIQESGARITHGPLPTVMGDATQLAQLFQNLIGNAIKFRRDQPPEICIRAEPGDAGWCFSVQDNGIGIESQYFDRIFQVFQRLHGRGVYPGTGIGLAICKKIVERHGGAIWVESVPDQGATFYFTIAEKGASAS